MLIEIYITVLKILNIWYEKHHKVVYTRNLATIWLFFANNNSQDCTKFGALRDNMPFIRGWFQCYTTNRMR
jgi:hypothetical protein